MCFWVLLIEISSRKAVPAVTSTYHPGPLHFKEKRDLRFFCHIILISFFMHQKSFHFDQFLFLGLVQNRKRPNISRALAKTYSDPTSHLSCLSLPRSHRIVGMRQRYTARRVHVWHGMVDVCDGYLATEASRSSFG